MLWYRPKFVKNRDKMGKLELNLYQLIVSIDKADARYEFKGGTFSQ